MTSSKFRASQRLSFHCSFQIEKSKKSKKSKKEKKKKKKKSKSKSDSDGSDDDDLDKVMGDKKQQLRQS